MIHTNMAMDGNGEVGYRSSDGTKATPEACSNCGRCIEIDEWHPVIANDDGDAFRIRAFCGEMCRNTWEQ